MQNLLRVFFIRNVNALEMRREITWGKAEIQQNRSFISLRACPE